MVPVVTLFSGCRRQTWNSDTRTWYYWTKTVFIFILCSDLEVKICDFEINVFGKV